MIEDKLIDLKKKGFLELDNLNLDFLNLLEKKIKLAFDQALKLVNEKDITNEKLNHFITRVDRGSLDLNCLHDSENLSINLIRNLEIIEIAKEYWSSKKIKYSRSHSKFRYVDPLNDKQIKYSPLHYDGTFLSHNKSINICIPFTGYGGDYPGLQIFPESKNFLKKMVIKKTQRFHFINYFLNSINPVVKKGSYICFNQNVYHRRTIQNCKKIRMNLEFRIFPEYVNDKNLELEFI
tara:strand:- start:872 stop:1579 length:708 start_codon:yes stop_codon:yes gene_type:complete